MDNSAVRNKWMDREALENYRHAMRICCMNALHVCSDDALSELCYDLDISRNGDARAYEHLLGGQCMVITSEPGGGKSYLMWLLLRDYLEDCRNDSDRLPVFLDGRDCGIVWDSIEKGIVRALSGHFPLVTEELVRERLRAGGFVLLVDAVDAQSETGSFLLSELYCLGHDTDSTVIIASRMQCDRRDFHSDFVYYTIDPVSDEQIIRWLERDVALGMIGGDENGQNREKRWMPGRLLEVLRTPLFIRICACCAPHVHFTGEIGMIRLTGMEKYKGGVRIQMLCGFRALADALEKERNVYDISAQLSAKPYEVAAAVEKLKNENLALKQEMTGMKMDILQEKITALPENEQNICFFDKHMDKSNMRYAFNLLVEKCSGLCGCFDGDDENGYRYVMGGRDVDVIAAGKAMNEALDGRGGGSKEMFQGSLKAAREQIEKYFANL